MENQIKSHVLKGIMKAMLERDGSRIRPKPVAPPPAPEQQAMPHMSEGGVVMDDRLHIGNDSDISEDDAKILESLFDEGQGQEGPNEVDESDEDDEAGKE